MLIAHHANRVETLVERLATLLAAAPGAPLATEQVIVPHPGTGRWLAQRLADRLGICADVAFPLPAHFVWQLFHQVLDDLPASHPYGIDAMSWRLFGMLGDSAAVTGTSLGDYLAGRDALGRFEMAARLAETFDRYLVYRADWIENWDRGEGDGWQPALWRRLVAAVREPHWVAVQRRFAAALDAGSVADSRLPARVMLFGVAALSPGYLDVLVRLATRIDVHLFVVNPCREYWGDIVAARSIGRRAAAGGEVLYLETGHPLLASLGRHGRDLVNQLEDAGALADESWQEPGTATLLHALQQDVLDLRDRGAGTSDPYVVADADASLQVHVAHGAQREMEILHDRLLGLLDADPTLTPADIAVLTPDIDAYAPHVESVFATASPGRRLPYAILGRATVAASPTVAAFLSLLDLPESRFPASAVLGLLEVPAIRARHGIAEGDLDTLRAWIGAAGIRWGVDGAARAVAGLPPCDEHTWRAGLDRLLLGYALPDEAGGLFAGVLPCGGVAGDEARLLGRFATFVEGLFALPGELAGERPVAAWADRLSALGDTLFSPDEGDEPALQAVRDAIEGLRVAAAAGGHGGPVPLALVRAELRRRLAAAGGGGRPLSGGITFAGMVPLRGLPFRVICLVGMDDDAFPGRARRFGFDLLADDVRRPGDRDARDDDRYLFLEALLAARDVFYTSYAGRDPRNGTTRPPSVLVSELLDCIRRCAVDEQGEDPVPARVVQHRLQPFSPRYFDGSDPRLFSYDDALRDAAEAAASPLPSAPFIATPLPEADAAWRSVTPERLIAFFVNASRFLVRRRLGFRLADDVDMPADEEPFALDWSAREALDRRLLERLMADAPVDDLLPTLRAAGLLPHGAVGAEVVAARSAIAHGFARQVVAHGGRDTLPDRDLHLEIGAFVVEGRLDGLTARGRLGFRLADLHASDRVRLWIGHLLLCAAFPDLPGESRWLAQDRLLTLAPCSDATAHLESLLALYWQGLHVPLPFFPKASWACARTAGDEGLVRARSAWEGNSYVDGEGANPYHDLLFGHREDPLDDAFATCASTFYAPLLAVATEGPP